MGIRNSDVEKKSRNETLARLKKLWAAVLARAIADMNSPNAIIRNDAIEFFSGGDDFETIWEIVNDGDMSANEIRATILSRASSQSRRKRTRK